MISQEEQILKLLCNGRQFTRTSILANTQWARCCHEVASNVKLDIATQFVIASNVLPCNGMAAFLL